MKLFFQRIFIFYCFLVLFTTNGLSKQKEIDFGQYVDLSQSYYFDNINKIPYSIYFIDNVGQIKVIFIPKRASLKRYFNSFELRNKIKAQYDEQAGSDYYSEKTSNKIDRILKKKLNFDASNYFILGVYIPISYISIDNAENNKYSILYPYEETIYYFTIEGKWALLNRFEIKDVADDRLKNNIKIYLQQILNKR